MPRAVSYGDIPVILAGAMHTLASAQMVTMVTTPAAPMKRLAPTGQLSRIREFAMLLWLWWIKYLLDYSTNRCGLGTTNRW